MSLTRVWEPKPMASPMTPAPAIRGPISNPRDDRMIRLTITNSTEKNKFSQEHQQSTDPGAAVTAFFHFFIVIRHLLPDFAVDAGFGKLPDNNPQQRQPHDVQDGGCKKPAHRQVDAPQLQNQKKQ